MTPTVPRSEPVPIPHKRLGEVLLEEEAITREQLEKALAIQRAEGGFVGQILVNLGFTTQEVVASCLVKQCKIPHLSLLDYDITQEVFDLVPREICEKHHLLPIDKLGRILTVAMVDPLDLEALEAVRKSCPELRIKPILCNWEHFVHVKLKLFQGTTKNAGPREVTASSLGLLDHMSPKEKKEWNSVGTAAPAAPATSAGHVDDKTLRDAVDSLIQQAAAAADVPQKNAPPASEPEPAQDLSRSVREEIRSAVREISQAVSSQHAEAPSPGLTQEGLTTALRDAMRDAMGALGEQLRARTDAPAAPPDHDLAQVVHESVAGAVHDALVTVAGQLQQQVAPGPAPSLDAFADVIRDSIGGAMQEAMATMMVHLRAMAGKRENEPGDQLAVGVVQALREGVHEIQAEQEARLAQIAEATLHSARQVTQLVESAVVSAGNRADLAGGRARHVSVTPFGKGGEAPPQDYEAADAHVLEAMDSEKPVESFTFDSFFPGKANVFTHQVSMAVAQHPGGEYNPFFLYGDVGVGKTHLISAIGNTIMQKNPRARVGYVSASHFARRLADATRDGVLDAFRENYCHWEALILDDIQFMGGRVEAQEEFFHIFNVLRQEGRQIIIASDKAPDRLGLLEQRLVSRFASGIVAQLKAPEWETRMQILRHCVQQAKAQVPEEILSLIAMRVPNDIRKMTGSLRKILAFATLVGQDLSCELAEEILSHIGVEQAA